MCFKRPNTPGYYKTSNESCLLFYFCFFKLFNTYIELFHMHMSKVSVFQWSFGQMLTFMSSVRTQILFFLIFPVFLLKGKNVISQSSSSIPSFRKPNLAGCILVFSTQFCFYCDLLHFGLVY